MSRSSSHSATSRSVSQGKVVNCPQCGASVVWDPKNRYRPFCSERCKMIDLGAWATESYRIPVEEDKDTLDTDDAEQSRKN
jgi:endogenous inhibitor of DNA gyrase (YacG/DUF329 family)